jgi:hypothetical protein
MIGKKRMLGLAAGAGFVAALPLLTGCQGESDGSAGGFLNEFSGTSSSRLATISTEKSDTGKEGIAGSKLRTASDAATVTADGKSASLVPDQMHGIERQKDLARNSDYDPAEVYGDAQKNIVVTSRPTGLNEENDTFLTFHENHVTNQLTKQTQYAAAYTGTRSDPDVVTALRGRSNHSATYTGTGSAYVGQGDFDYHIDGILNLTARFNGADAGLAGQIVQTKPADLATNPNGVNAATFTGQFIDKSPDYTIGDIRLRNPDGEVAAITEGGGVGSFFGSHAQGTMGAFVGTGRTTNDSAGAGHSSVNVIGSFEGKTSDNN